MENKKQITKRLYVFMCFGLIIVGSVLTGIFYYLGLKGFTSQLANFLALSEMLVGVGIGLAIARTFKIEGVDNGNI